MNPGAFPDPDYAVVASHAPAHDAAGAAAAQRHHGNLARLVLKKRPRAEWIPVSVFSINRSSSQMLSGLDSAQADPQPLRFGPSPTRDAEPA
jgi:hypothetical protein